MIDLLEIEKSLISKHVKHGGTAVDFTMGNGHDTLWLSNAVGENGRVYAFDIQEQALRNTEQLLDGNARYRNYTLVLDSHANAEKYVNGRICAGLFNLGYLPGSDKTVTTMRQSTMCAVEAALRLLDDDGGLLIAVYPGHEEGRLEGEMLEKYFSGLDRRKICVSEFQIVNSPASPFFFIAEKK